MDDGESKDAIKGSDEGKAEDAELVVKEDKELKEIDGADHAGSVPATEGEQQGRGQKRPLDEANDSVRNLSCR